jgi:PST family polysaccharide transporter
MIAFAGMAASAELTLIGRDVVRLLLGAKWSESGRIFEIFGPGIGVMLLCTTVSWIHLSIGRPGRLLRWNLVELAATASLFLVTLRWGPAGVAAAWSIAYWILLIPAFWYAGRPIKFGVSVLISAIWRYAVAALVGGLATAAIIQRTSFWGTPSSSGSALVAIIAISALFMTIYLVAVILFHGGFAPLRQLSGLLRELAPSRKASTPAAEALEGYK